MVKKLNNELKLTIILVSIFILSMLPIIIISFFSFPAYDDFNHSMMTSAIARNGGSLVDIINGAIQQVINIYYGWQGTYSAIFLSALQPGVFGVDYYFLTPLILIGVLIFANYYACKMIFNIILKNKSSIWIIVGTVINFLQIQNLPSAQEGFFWWAGGIMHTFFFSLLLIQVALVLKILFSNKTNFIRIFVLLLLIFISGGGSYETALASFTIFITCLFFILIYNKENKKNLVILVVSSAMSLIFLLINVLAPGNLIRVNLSGIHVPALLAIVESFVYAGVHLFEYTSLGTVTLALIISYAVYPIVKNRDFKKINPLFFGAVTFCTYATFFTPAIYAENYVASLRYLNVLYFAFYWIFIGNIINFINYYKENKFFERGYSILNDFIGGNPFKQAIIIIFLLFSSVLQFSYLDATSSSATVDLLLGNAQAFKQINQERMNLLLDENKENVVLPQYKNEVRIFYMDYIETEAHRGKNGIYEKYFNKDSVVAEEEFYE